MEELQTLRKQLKSEVTDLEATLAKLRSLLALGEAFDEVVLLTSQLTRSENDRLFQRQTNEAANVERSRITEATLKLIDSLRPEWLQTEAAYKLHPSHRFTCDRTAHFRLFNDLFNQGKDAGKVHFFYLYGYWLQSHDGFFERIACNWDGKLASKNKSAAFENRNRQDEKTGLPTSQTEPPAAAAPACRVLQKQVVVESDGEERYYKLNVLCRLFEEFNIFLNSQEPLINKDIAWFQQKVVETEKLKKEDYVAVLFRIEEAMWDAELTPKITAWFIREFCAAPLPDDSPTFLFFFAIIFDTENSDAELQVNDLVQKSELLNALPELDMVASKDVDKWLAIYHYVFSSPREQMEMKNRFKQLPEHYMDDVEDVLGELIEAYNERVFKGIQK